MAVIRKGAPDDLCEESVLELLRKGIYKPNPSRVTRFLKAMGSENGHFYIAFEEGRPIGILAAVEAKENQFEIKAAIVEPEHRNSGIGRLLVNELITKMQHPLLRAETDDGAVGFYHSLGFRIHSLGEKYPGVIRYQCVYDHSNWVPHS